LGLGGHGDGVSTGAWGHGPAAERQAVAVLCRAGWGVAEAKAAVLHQAAGHPN
jgi:hypothetical protein